MAISWQATAGSEQVKAGMHAVPPTVIDQIWSEVDRWHLWDPDTKQVRQGLPKTMRSLKAYAEKRHAALHDGEVDGAKATTA